MREVDPTTVVGRYIDECWNHGRIDLIDELVARDFVDHLPFDDDLPNGTQGLKASIRLVRMAFSDLHLLVEDMIAEDDRVVVRFRLEGTHNGMLAGRLASLKRVMIAGMAIYRVENFQIADQWCMFDLIGLMQQIGAREEFLAFQN
ncbi:ester cyclase [soil metagenome]